MWWRRGHFREQKSEKFYQLSNRMAQNHKLMKKIQNCNSKQNVPRDILIQFGQRPKTEKLKFFSWNVIFLEHFLRRASVQFGNLAEKSKKSPGEVLSNSLSTRWVQFWKELSVSLVSCPKSLNKSLKFWNWWINFFLQNVCLDT